MNADHVLGFIVGVSGTWVAQDVVDRVLEARKTRRSAKRYDTLEVGGVPVYPRPSPRCPYCHYPPPDA